MKLKRKPFGRKLCAVLSVVFAAHVCGVFALYAVVTNTGCGHPTGVNYIFYPCDERHGPPCSSSEDSCQFEWLPPGIYWGGTCQNTSVDAYDCLMNSKWYGITTTQKGRCLADCSCLLGLDGPPFEDSGGGAMCYLGDLCTG
jgi:hypothetical protein